MGRIRIVSDGTSENTKVFDASGNHIEGITGIGIDITVKGGAIAYLNIRNPIIDITAEHKEES